MINFSKIGTFLTSSSIRSGIMMNHKIKLTASKIANRRLVAKCTLKLQQNFVKCFFIL